MITYILYGLFLLSCIVLVISVLLQPGKADAGALFSSSVSSTAFGPRGTQTILAKITIGAAVSFMLLALMLALPAVTGSRSVLQSQSEEAVPAPQPPPATSPAGGALPSTEAPGANSSAADSNAGAANTNSAPASSSSSSSPQARTSPGKKK